MEQNLRSTFTFYVITIELTVRVQEKINLSIVWQSQRLSQRKISGHLSLAT